MSQKQPGIKSQTTERKSFLQNTRLKQDNKSVYEERRAQHFSTCSCYSKNTVKDIKRAPHLMLISYAKTLANQVSGRLHCVSQ